MYKRVGVSKNTQREHNHPIAALIEGCIDTGIEKTWQKHQLSADSFELVTQVPIVGGRYATRRSYSREVGKTAGEAPSTYLIDVSYGLHAQPYQLGARSSLLFELTYHSPFYPRRLASVALGSLSPWTLHCLPEHYDTVLWSLEQLQARA